MWWWKWWRFDTRWCQFRQPTDLYLLLPEVFIFGKSARVGQQWQHVGSKSCPICTLCTPKPYTPAHHASSYTRTHTHTHIYIYIRARARLTPLPPLPPLPSLPLPYAPLSIEQRVLLTSTVSSRITPPVPRATLRSLRSAFKSPSQCWITTTLPIATRSRCAHGSQQPVAPPAQNGECRRPHTRSGSW